MADSKITALTSISTSTDPANDPLVIVDVSDTSMAATGTTKKVTLNQLLGASGTATLASATITGDLTVDTSTLKVDSTNNRVGIGTASPGAIFDIYQATLGTAYFRGGYAARQMSITATSDGSNDGAIHTFSIGSSAGQFAFANSSGTRMTLDSSGNLGLGVTPSAKFDVGLTGAGTPRIRFTSASDNPILEFQRYSGVASDYYGERILTGGGFFFQSAPAAAVGSQTFTTNMSLDASGNLGIGVTPSAWVSYQKAIDFGGAGNYGSVSARTDFSSFATNCYFNGTSWIYKNTYPAYSYEHTGGVHKWNTAPSGTAGTAITFTQAMTLDASGILVVGNTAAASVGVTGGWLASPNSGNSYELIGHNSGSASGSVYSYFFYNSSQIGSITQNGTTGVLYNTTSDYRLKESVQPIANGLARVNALKPSIYKWKVDGSNGEGFIAHELAEVVPFAVSGEKDAVNEDGSIKPQGVDLSKVVPILVAAIQELAAEVNALKNA